MGIPKSHIPCSLEVPAHASVTPTLAVWGPCGRPATQFLCFAGLIPIARCRIHGVDAEMGNIITMEEYEVLVIMSQ